MCDMHKSVLNSAVRIKTLTDSYVGAELGQGQAAAPIMKCKKPHPGQPGRYILFTNHLEIHFQILYI